MKKLFAIALPIGILLTMLGGCAGYQLGAVKPSVYEGIDRIFVPVFKNETLEPRISSLVTNAVLKQIQLDGTYQVSRESEADAILRGTIRRVRKNQLRAVRTDTLRSRELGLFLYVEWYLEDPATGKRIANRERSRNDEKIQEDIDEYNSGSVRTRPGLVIGDTIQFVDASFQVGERNAMAVAAEDAAKKLVNQLAEGW